MESIVKLASEHLKMLQETQKCFHENSAARSVVGQHISKLDKQIRSIENAMKNIQNISMQVKILSLNASVEAARAGAAGKGFSVVAEEIRQLSENTDAAAIEIDSATNTLNTLIKCTTDDMFNAQKIGSVFAKTLDACVDNAQNLNVRINGIEAKD